MTFEKATKLHQNVPPDWYYRSIKENIFQRFWHKMRFKEISKLVEKTDGKILDIGSADGVFTKVILEKSGARKVIGIDVLKSSVDWANKHWKTKRVEFILADANDLKFKDETFDAVFALEVLEHVETPFEILKDIKRVLKKDGYAVFLVPTDSLLFEIIWFFWTRLRGKIWKDTHIQTYKGDYLIKLSKQAGFKVELNKKFLLGMLQAVKVRK